MRKHYTQVQEKHFVILGYIWQPVFSDTFAWRPCTAFEATKKNCPRGEPCMADLRYNNNEVSRNCFDNNILFSATKDGYPTTLSNAWLPKINSSIKKATLAWLGTRLSTLLYLLLE